MSVVDFVTNELIQAGYQQYPHSSRDEKCDGQAKHVRYSIHKYLLLSIYWSADQR